MNLPGGLRATVNGQATDNIALTDRGLAYGDGIFETIRVVGGVMLRWPYHLRRLQRSLTALHFDPACLESLEAELLDLVADDSGVLRVSVTRGSGPRGYRLPASVACSRIALFDPAPPAAWPAEGVRAMVCNLRLAQQPALAGLKHLNRLEQVLACAEVQQSEFDEGLLLSVDGRVIEATSSNLLVVSNGAVVTPDLRDCGVAGVMRDWLMDQLTDTLAVRVADVPLEDLLEADEVIICNSLMGVTHLCELQQCRWQAGPLQAHLRQLLEEGDSRNA